MPRPAKYKTAEERAEAKREQKARSGKKRRREARGLDPLAPHSGEVGTGAKLTDEQVAEIRRLKAEAGWTNITLARQFGVSGGAISLLLRGKTW